MTIQFDEDKSNQRLDELHKKEEQDFAKLIAEKFQLDYIDLMLVPINTEALRLIKEETARQTKIAAFNLVGKKVQVAVLSPSDPDVVAALKDLGEAGFSAIVFVTTTEGLEKAWAHYKELSYSTESTAGALEVSSDEMVEFLNKVHNVKDISDLIQTVLAQKKSYRISRIIEIMIAGALATKASDIHIEPEEEYARLRYRLDGVLNDVLKFDKETYALVNSRIKLLSGQIGRAHI